MNQATVLRQQAISLSRRLVTQLGEGNWSRLVTEFPGRIGKQLRERWNHELRPDITKAAWTPDEEVKLVNEHRRTGNSWADIARVRPASLQRPAFVRISSVVQAESTHASL